ncbi:MAG TPA: amino acid ABC transporter permease [Frankiaceae bacterium]|nr:amino acid ABC transporter permease [Frankiaceae bacterium]
MTDGPEPIRAVPVRHPGRWVALAVIAVLVAMFVNMLVTNDAFQWRFMFENMFREPVLEGVKTSLTLTVYSMILGVLLGITIAVMRLSDNRIISTVAWFYTWFFRAVPRLVLCVLCGNLGILLQRIEVGVPFGGPLSRLTGLEAVDGKIWGADGNTILVGFFAGLLALTLSEAAYMAEIVRAGILSVDAGQSEAAQALGMSRGLTMRKVVLPQAMRVIVPPTGNETIAMLKDTALVAAVPVTTELFFQLSAIGSRTFQPFPMYVAACLWYVGMTSVLLVGQHYLEKRFSRGVAGQMKVRALTMGASK